MIEEEKNLALIEDPIIKDLVRDSDEESINQIRLTPRELKQLKKYAIMIRYGDHNLIPMICTGSRCIVKARCPLLEFGKSPIGKVCPFESFALIQWQKDYIESLKVEIEDKVERSQILDLVEADILNARANIVLADEGFIMENPIGIDENTGEPITRKEEHIALKLKERAQNRKDKILKAFLATREQKLKTMEAMRKDPTEYMAELREKARRVSEKHDKAIDAEFVEKVEKKEEANNEPF